MVLMDKKAIYAGIIILAAAVIVSYIAISSAASSVVKVGDYIAVNYTGTLTNGTVFGSSATSGPLQFTVGSNELIPGFDQAVIGMKLGQEKTVTIPANDAYGQINPNLIVKVPIADFMNQSVQVGETVSQESSGQSEQGIVTAVNATTVTVDFNSPLAGQTLIFKITVIAIDNKT